MWVVVVVQAVGRAVGVAAAGMAVAVVVPVIRVAVAAAPPLLIQLKVRRLMLRVAVARQERVAAVTLVDLRALEAPMEAI